MISKRKIVNDPVHGFISIQHDLIFDLIEHPYFQRLRRIKQLGLTSFVYPGAMHTRFQHALGALHLMGLAVNVLRSRGHEITQEEFIAVEAAILLHDIGHGPFSHALERTIMDEIHHEALSLLFMHELNDKFQGRLEKTIRIFKDQYPKKFLNQLVSSQLDMDRLDYLKRDSFFTGVTEGVIGSDRIIKMLNQHQGSLVLESKGIYSIEKFLIARRLMYWQVYLHKTVIAAEKLLYLVLKRARYLADRGEELFATPSFKYFLYREYPWKWLKDNQGHFDRMNPEMRRVLLEQFSRLDDDDVFSSAKVWTGHPDRILSFLSKFLINRRLFRIEISKQEIDGEYHEKLLNAAADHFNVTREDAAWLVQRGTISNHAYDTRDEKIQIRSKDGSVQDITQASDMLDEEVLSRVVEKNYICYPKEISAGFTKYA